MKLQKNLHTSLVVLVDITLMVASLYGALAIRYFFDSGFSNINDLFLRHISYFIPLIILTVSILYISLAYNDTILAYLKRSIPKLAEALAISAALGVFYFYIFAAYLPISPKITYALFFGISFVVLSLSRTAYAKLPLLGAHINAIVLMKEGSIYESVLEEAEIHVPRATFTRVSYFHIDAVMEALHATEATSIVYDNTDKDIVQLISMLPTHIIRSIPVFSEDLLYEQLFNKIFLPTLTGEFLLKEYLNKKPFFEIMKRCFDLIIAIPLGIISLPLIALAALAIYVESGRPVFIFQERFGLGRHMMRIPKLRTMTKNNNGVWINEGENKITHVGAFLRKTRVDELPQLWSVIKGDMSLIGPRPDMTGLEARLREEIDFYHTRYTAPPGLSGWAQVTQTIVPQSVEETRERFAYDMYYIKHRSLFLDFSIALKTIRILLSRVGH